MKKKRQRVYNLLNLISLLLIITLIFFVRSCKNNTSNSILPPRVIQAMNLRFEHYKNLVLIIFDLKNSKDKNLICNASFFVYNNTEELLRFNTTLGILPSNSTTLFVVPKELPTGETRVIIKPRCELLNESIDEMITEWITKTGLKQCNYKNKVRDIDQKTFCIAFLKKDITYCNYILNDYRRKHCFAIITKKPSFCGEIQTITGRDWCFKDLAVNFGEINICKNITNDLTRKSCYGILNNNVSQCLGINNTNEKYYCITMLAIKQKNINLCDKLQDLNLTNECKKEAKFSFI